MIMPVIGVIEWSSDSGAEPAVFLGYTAEQVRAQAVRVLWAVAENGDLDYIDDEWVAEHPMPDLADAAEVLAWLENLREVTTDGWFTIFYGSSEGHGSGNYHDLRGQ